LIKGNKVEKALSIVSRNSLFSCDASPEAVAEYERMF
jgi:hypothetical protein